VASALLGSARALATIAEPEDRFGNAIAVIAIHAAIAFNDALPIAYAGIKSTDGDHERASDLLLEALGHRVAAEQVDRFRSVVKMKDRASYQGDYYSVSDAVLVLARAEAFGTWAQQMYLHRPP
jgi:hypothetical protein